MPKAMNVALFASVAMIVCSCAGDTTAPASRDAAQIFGGLRLDQHAITLAMTPPHNTIQLHTRLLSQAGTAFPESGTVRYQIVHSDTSVTVSPSGLVTAKAPSYGSALAGGFFGSNAVIIASLTVQGTTRSDTAAVVVTATEPAAPLATFSIHPPAESLSVYMSGHWLQTAQDPPVDLNLIQLDSHGDTIPNQLVYYGSSNTSVAYPYAGGDAYGRSVRAITPDTVTFFAQTWYYGVARSDSLQVRVGYPLFSSLTAFEHTPLNSLTPELYWWPQTLEVTAPASIAFFNYSRIQAIDMVFDNPAGVETDTATISLFYDIFGYTFPLSAPGSIAPFFADTTGHAVICAARDTSVAADSTCVWMNNLVAKRFRLFTKPGTYTYHTLFGDQGRIIVH